MTNEFLLGVCAGLILAGGVGLGVYLLRPSTSRSTLERIRIELTESQARIGEIRKQREQWKAESTHQRAEMRALEREWVADKTRLAFTEKHLVEQKSLVEQAKAQLTESFGSLAAQALASNNRGFLDLAADKFNAFREQSTGDLDARKRAIESIVGPVQVSLSAYQKAAHDLEEKRMRDLGAIGEQLRSVASGQAQLHQATSQLVNALKSPQIRGRWGEVALRRTAELAGMVRHCDISEQESTTGEDGTFRPDMLVRLPTNRVVVVDSKVPLGGFIDAYESTTDAGRQTGLALHAKQVAAHIDRLSAKEYWAKFEASPEFVVLFIPNDSFLAAAAETDPHLVETALGKKVILATPSTLVALLRAIEHGWRQHHAIENAQKISNLGQEMSDRFAVLVEHFAKMGGSLSKAVECYNAAVSSFEQRILPSARRFKELGAVGRREIEKLTAIDPRPRGREAVEEEGVMAETG